MKIFKILLPGLLAAQIIATLDVYMSNAGLSRALAAVKHAGYITIPGPHIACGLQDAAPAILGGMFFTLSIGTFISLLSILAVWVWDRIFSRNKWILIPMLVLWILCLAAVNSQGLCLGGTAYFLVIPPVVFGAAKKWMPRQNGKKTALREAVCVLPLLFLALLWATQMGDNLFISIRDHLLLSNPVGAKINDFYYRYTMYPAEVFKTLDQKTIKTCNLESVRNYAFTKSLERTLTGYDYFDTAGSGKADLTLKEEKGTLLFLNRGDTILQTSIEDFSRQPAIVLKAFSDRSDRYAFFRDILFLSILIGFPVFLYVVAYAGFQRALGFFLSPPYPSIIAAMICLSLGAALLLPFLGGAGSINENDLAGALQSKKWQHKTAALRLINEKGLDLAGFGDYGKMLSSPHVPERYWLAVALGAGRGPETYRDILGLLDDPSPNVVCKAFEALGRRGNEDAVSMILQRIDNAKHQWYEQWYAYKALKALGWNQTRSQ
jgi:hypothetical protein